MEHRVNANYSLREYQVKSGIKFTEMEMIDALEKVSTILRERELAGQDIWMYLYYVSRMGPDYKDGVGGS